MRTQQEKEEHEAFAVAALNVYLKAVLRTAVEQGLSKEQIDAVYDVSWKAILTEPYGANKEYQA